MTVQKETHVYKEEYVIINKIICICCQIYFRKKNYSQEGLDHEKLKVKGKTQQITPRIKKKAKTGQEAYREDLQQVGVPSGVTNSVV